MVFQIQSADAHSLGFAEDNDSLVLSQDAPNGSRMDPGNVGDPEEDDEEEDWEEG
jgi:hypothetical protein